MQVCSPHLIQQYFSWSHCHILTITIDIFLKDKVVQTKQSITEFCTPWSWVIRMCSMISFKHIIHYYYHRLKIAVKPSSLYCDLWFHWPIKNFKKRLFISTGPFMDWNLGLYDGAKRPKCNPNFTSEIRANDQILQPTLYC